jgi:uncharacterized sulfatase
MNLTPVQRVARTAAGLLAVALLTTLPGAAAAKPNVILIYSDDHGWADLGAQGVDADIRTPHLDQLARDGVRFARGYVTAPQCVPSRAGVITGRHQQRFGVEDNLKGPLPLAEITIAERLKPAGYVSAQVGKWHLEATARSEAGKAGGDEFAFLPGAQGFDEYYTGPMNTFVASHDLQGNPLPKAPQRLTDRRFRCVWQTDAALSFITRHAREPFFLYLAYYTPHVPLESPEPWFSRTPALLPKERRQALAMIAAMDEGIGRLRETLRTLGLERNTLIFFIGDNGAPLKDGAWNGSLNLPLTGEKGMLTDGGIRTPFLAAWPGTFPAGRTYEHPVSALDDAATANALAGLPPDARLDGVNLVPFETGERAGPPHDALFWRWRSQAAVLEFPWKLIRLGPTERFLFDVTRPDGETRNRLADEPGIAARLEARLAAWTKDLRPPGLPTDTNAQDQLFFDAHVTKTGAAVTKRRAGPAAAAKETRPSADLQGWLLRNGTAALRDGALVVTPDAGGKARPFLTLNGLDLPGPVTVRLRVRAARAGSGTLSWRSKGSADFAPGQVATFTIPASAEWRDVEVALPVEGNLLHLRLHASDAGAWPEIQTITLQGKNGAQRVWRFGGPG